MRSHQKTVIFFCLIMLVVSCNSATTETDKNIISNQPKAAITQSPSNNQNEQNPVKSIPNSKELQPEDVSIDVKIPGVSSIEKKVLPAELPPEEEEVPGIIHPRCVAIDFKGDYTKDYRRGEWWFSARLVICPVDEYRKIFATPDSLAKDFEDKIRDVDHILLLRPTRINPDFPTLLNLGASPQFTVNLNFIPFKNGEGFFVMTQYGMEATIINNNQLKYMFQGFTTDKKYYIWGIFPVKSKHLPNDDSDLEKIREINKDGDIYDEYIINVKKKLKDKSSFTPKLEEIEETVKSLEIRQP